MDLKKTFGFNKEKAEQGVWFSYDETTRIKVAKIGTLKYQNVVTRLSKPYQSRIRNNRLTPEDATHLTAQVLAECILLAWEGLEEEGISVIYSRAEALRLLETYVDFRAFVETCANDTEEFQEAGIIADGDADAKNSLISSNGN